MEKYVTVLYCQCQWHGVNKIAFIQQNGNYSLCPFGIRMAQIKLHRHLRDHKLAKIYDGSHHQREIIMLNDRRARVKMTPGRR